MDQHPAYDELKQQLCNQANELQTLQKSYDDLRLREKQYQELLDLFPVSFYEISLLTGKFSNLNALIPAHTGYSIKEMAELNPYDLMTEKSKLDFLERTRLATNGARLASTQEYEIITKDKKQKWLLVNMKLVRENGTPVALRCMAFDITARKKMEENLRESEERFRTLAELLPETIFETNENGILTFVNHNAHAHFRYSLEDVKAGLNIFDMVAPVDRDRAIRNFNRILTGEAIGIKEYLLIRKDNTTFPGMVLAAGIDKNGKVAGLRGFVVDLTDNKRLEAQLAQSQKMESIGTMAGGIAHDFNNILGAIIGYSELLSLFQTLDEEEIASYVNKILEAGYRAKDLVKRILMFSRRTDPEKKPIRVVPVLQESLNFLRASLPSTIEFNQHVEKVKDTIYADATQIHQVLMNLGTNAGHAMREKGGKLDVRIANMDVNDTHAELLINLKPGPHIKISVRDNGCGMPPEIKDRIFEPYFTTKEQGEGTGLGLSVVHGIVTNHNGAITVDSLPGKGTEFCLYFPVISGADLEIKKRVPHIIPKGTERILFVDDEKSLAKLGNEMFKYLGYTVTTATSSLEALNLFNARPSDFDLVITDMTMPMMTGADLASALLLIRPDIPIILCTGYSETITESRAKEMGINAYMTKPIVLHEIAQVIRRVLDSP